MIAFGYLGSFEVPYEFEDGLFYFCIKKYCWDFYRNCTESVWCCATAVSFSTLLLRCTHVAMWTLGLLSYLNFCCSLMVTHPLPWGTYGSSWFPRSTTKLIHKKLHDISMQYRCALIRVIESWFANTYRPFPKGQVLCEHFVWFSHSISIVTTLWKMY